MWDLLLTKTSVCDRNNNQLQEAFDGFINAAAKLVMPVPFPYFPSCNLPGVGLDTSTSEFVDAFLHAEKSLQAANTRADEWLRFVDNGPTAASSDDMPTPQNVAQCREDTRKTRPPN